MEWMLLMKQGGGCDYTIGCGINYEIFEADNKEAAIKHATFLLEEGGHLNTGPYSSPISSADLIEIGSQISLDVPGLIQAKKDEEAAAAAKKKERDERAEFERLKGKYGSG